MPSPLLSHIPRGADADAAAVRGEIVLDRIG